MTCYEYLCERCGIHQEIYLPMSDYKTPQYCKKCGRKLMRVISKPAVIIPAWWTDSKNDYDAIAKPRTPEQKRKYKEFMEHSIPISQSTK